MAWWGSRPSYRNAFPRISLLFELPSLIGGRLAKKQARARVRRDNETMGRGPISFTHETMTLRPSTLHSSSHPLIVGVGRLEWPWHK